MKGKELVNLFLTIIVAATFMVTLALASPQDANAAENQPQFKWRVQTAHAPAEAQKLLRPILDDIEKASAGRIKFEVYSSGQLMPDDQTIPALKAGTLDMIENYPPNMAIPLDFNELDANPPFGWKSAVEIWTIYEHKGLKEIYDKAYDELGGIKFLGINTTDPIHILSRKPITKYDDFKGLKISASRVIAQPLIDAGASAVNVPVEEFYLSGQTGILDALAWCGATEAKNNSWNEVFPYFLTNNIGGNALLNYLANEKSWKALPPDLQQIIIVGLKAGALKKLLYYYNGEPANWKYYKTTSLSTEDWAKIRASQEKRWAELAKKSPRCAAIVKIYMDYNKEVEDAGWFRCK